MDTDRNLLFGVLALQADLIDADRFARACSDWAARKSTPLADLLQERGWISGEDRSHVEFLLERKLRKHGGDAHASLAAAADDQVRSLIAGTGDAEVCDTLTGLPRRGGHTLLSTVAYQPESRERYTLTHLHAKGGIGQVWLALDGDLGRHVALKELRPERADHPELWARFLEEAKITGQLEHPGIVPVYELARRSADGQPFYTMRFIRGRTLSEAIKDYHRKRRDGEVGPLELAALLTAFVGVCQALAYAHSRKVIHRDLKPLNVVLGDFGEVIVLDWGLAKLVDRPDNAAPLASVALGADEGREATIQGQVLGTPAYMAPEQAEGRLDRVDHRSDVYGLGAILYEILTGRPPFAGPEPREVLRQVAQEEPARPRSVVPTTPAALEAVCLKALAKAPHGRYGTAGELAAEIQRFLAGEPVAAYPEPLVARTGRWVRRHRTPVAVAAALLVTATIALAVGTLLLGQANRRVQEQRDLARNQRDLASANFQKARQAVDTFLTNVGEEQLLNQPGLQPLRLKLLRSALDYYQDFVRQRADDPALRRQLAEAYRRLGDIQGELGQRREAIAALEQAVVIFERLRAGSSADAELSLDLARTLQSLAFFRLRGGAAGPGEAAVRAAIALLEPLERDHPEVAEYGRRLGRCYDLLGVVGIVSGRKAQYLPYWDEAIAVFDRTIARHPQDLEARALLVRVYQNRSSGLEGAYDYEQAIQSSRRAVLQARQLRELAPENPSFGYGLAMANAVLAEMELEMGWFLTAEHSGGSAVDLLTPLWNANPSVAQYRSWLFSSSVLRARALVRLEQPRSARTSMRQAQELIRQMGPESSLDQLDRERLADLERDRAGLLAVEGRWSEVVPILEANLGRRDRQFRESSDHGLYFSKWIWARGALIEARLRAGLASTAESIAALTQVLEETETDSRRRDWPTIRVDRGEILVQRATLEAEAGKLADAESTLGQAVVTLESESASHPQRFHWKLALARAVSLRSELRRRADRATEALADARLAVELVRPTIGEGSGYLYELGAFQTSYRDLADALKAAPERDPPPDLSTCLETLESAVAAGFDNAARLRSDARLKLLRERLQPAFDRLVARSEARGKVAPAQTEAPVSP